MSLLHKKNSLRTLAAVGLAGALMTALVSPATAAATTLSASGLSATATGTSVTASTTIASSSPATAAFAGICARSASGANRDFPLDSNVALTANGTTITKTATLPTGAYTYWSCAKVDGVWKDIGAKQTVTVGGAATTTTSTSTASSTPTSTSAPTSDGTSTSVATSSEVSTSSPTSSAATSTTSATTSVAASAAGTTIQIESATSSAMPTSPSGEGLPVGNLPGFKQIFTDDFTTDVALGGFPGVYKSKWGVYDGFKDSFGGGMYNKKIISVQGGLMDMFLHVENGKGQVSAPVPLLKSGSWSGQTYGKYTVRFKSDSLPGYKAAWLLWPDSNNWNEGEIDFPEGSLNGKMMGFNHCVGNPSKNCDWVDTKTNFTGWHTASLEWKPGSVAYIMDGKTLLTTKTAPSTPMHWVLQTESASSNVAAMTTPGHLQIDWVSVYSYTG